MNQLPRLWTTPSGRVRRLAVVVLVGLLAALALALVPARSASAAELPGAITSVSTDKTAYGYNDRLTLHFGWAVPDTATAGDTFTLDLPDELKALSLAKFSLAAPDGSDVADAVWDGKKIVFTLTDYVDSHDSVAGSGFVTVQWDHGTVDQETGPIVLDFDGHAVPVTIGAKPAPPAQCTTNCPPPAQTPTSRGLGKSGSFTDGAYEGTSADADNIAWTVRLPGNATGYPQLDVVDTPAAGSVIDCATFAVRTQDSLAGGTPSTVVDASRYTLDCSADTFTLHLGAIAGSEFITVTYKGTITDQRSGSYANHVAVTAPGTTASTDTTVKRQAAGGVGDGVQSVSVGDLVWMDADHDGRQSAGEKGIAGVALVLSGPDGHAVTDIHGATVAPVVTDASGHYLFPNLPVLPAGQHYIVTIDPVASKKALAGLEPTTAHAGADRALDSSRASAESADLSTNGAQDLTLDFGFVLPDLPTLALPGGDGSDPGTEQPTTTASVSQLAHTGVSDPTPGVLIAVGLLVLGVVTALLARRRRA
jgi:hypothetical protein